VEVGFYQFLTSSRSFRQDLKEVVKRRVMGGASITGCTLEAALGRPMQGALAPTSLKHTPFDLAAISFNTPGAPMAYSAAKHLKALGKTVLAGGPHPSVLPNEALRYFDAVCIGPGDVRFPMMVADAEKGQLKPVYQGGPGDWVIPERRRSRGLSIVQSSRGCCSSCHFCIVPSLFPGPVDEKPMELIEAELATTSGSISIVDDNFPLNGDHGKRVLSLLRDLGKSFYCQVSAESASDTKSLKILAEAGCTLVGIGVESISQKSRSFLGKTSITDPAGIIKRIHDAGMGSYINLVFGSDGETFDIFEKTLRFVEDVHPTVVSPHILTPFPGTKIYDYFETSNRLLFETKSSVDAWSLFDCRHIVIAPNPMTPEELGAGFSTFMKEIFSLRSTIRRARRGTFGAALLSSVLKNEW
jgi:radical SAM superfamily enzyme YgiQ (UPF0313 family)